MPYDLLIINGLVCTASEQTSCDIGVNDGKIAFLGFATDQEKAEAVELVDAEGGHVMPGGIDAHVHICQDSGKAVCADNFETGSRSAAAGGTTTFIPFACQLRKDGSIVKVVQEYHTTANSTGSYIDYGFHIIITNPTKAVINEMPMLMADGVSSCKIFMTYDDMKLREALLECTGSEYGVLKHVSFAGDNELLDIMLAAKTCKMTVMMHAENGDIINWLTDQLEQRSMLAPHNHALSRPPAIEGEAVNRAIVLSTLVDNPILFVHVSGIEATNAIRAAKTAGKAVYGETCPQYLYLTWDDLQRFHHPNCFENSKHICSPPPGPSVASQDSLWAALNNGTMTIFSSDHCPYKFDSGNGKILGITEGEPMRADDVGEGGFATVMEGKEGRFKHIPNGCPGVETRLPLLYKGLEAGKISTETFVQVTSTNVAKLYGLYPKKGSVLPGSDADFTIWYPIDRLQPFKLSNDMLHHNVDYTPYEGIEFTNWPRYTISRGRVIWKEGEVVGSSTHGKFLHRGPSSVFTTPRAGGGDVSSVATWL